MNDTLLLHNDINEIPKLAEWLEMLGEELDIPMSSVFQLNLALEEAVVNVMTYAYPGQEGMPVCLHVDNESGILTFTLKDEGVPFDPTQKEEPDITLDIEDRPIGGLGIFLVNQYMSSVSYQRKAGENILTMTFKI